MKKSNLNLLFISIIAIAITACGGSTNKEKSHSDHSDHADHSSMSDASDNDADGPKQLPVAEGAKVWFGNLNDGDTISMPFMVKFEVEGMEIEPAGKLTEGMGHHHLIINGDYIERGTVVPSDSTNIHYGQGQTETELTLDPGSYSLTMQFADGFHQSYGEQMSASISVVVE